MSRPDVETFQSFCLRYINRAVKNHFADISEDDIDNLSLTSPRQVIKRICIHRDSDPMTLTIGRLLIYYFETKNLLDEYIYGIPVTTFHETQKFKPQIKILWREDYEDARNNNRLPTKARYTVRWRGDYATQNDINRIKLKINSIFNRPTTHSFYKGRIKYSYYDQEKGYRLLVTARDETEAKDVINKLLEIQDDNPLNEEYFGIHTKEANWNETETIRVAGDRYKKPERRPVGKVKFVKAEFKVHGMTHDILLTDRYGVNLPSANVT